MRHRNRFVFGIVAIFAVSITICASSIAQDSDKTIAGIARGASLFFELHRQCSDIFEINENSACRHEAA
jgi:hypothetical protein